MTERRYLPGPIGLISCYLGIAALSALLVGCKEEVVPEPFVPSHAHEAYIFGLEQSGLKDTALSKDWIQAADRALAAPQKVELPLRESIFVDPSRPASYGFQFATLRGQVIKILIEERADPDLRLFIDVFRPVEEVEAPYVLIASAAQDRNEVQFEPQGDNEYILRLQPELLRGGRFTVSISTQPTFDFPVQGRTTKSILSPYGAPRDAGRRSHHGVDIFAPRHTPVLAPVRAYVRSVGENDLGGNVVWLRDPERNLNLYFAHLQEHKVEEGQWVEPGDLVGTVGNSGNARTTPTHLHFGVYLRRRGPVNPYYYLHSISGDAAFVEVDSTLLGNWVRPQRDGLRLRQGPSRRRPVLGELESSIPLRIVGAAGDYLKVQLPDGLTGYAAMRLVTPDPEPLGQETLARDSEFWSEPTPAGVPVGRLAAGSEVDILGEFASFKLVQDLGRMVWLPSGEAIAVVAEEGK